MSIAVRGLLPWVVACGVPSPANRATTTAGTGETGDADGGVDGNGNADESDDEGGEPNACAAEIAALVPFVTRDDGGCSVVLRIHHETNVPLGYQATCSARPDAALDEAQARALTDCCTSEGEGLEPPEAWAPWVFHAPPGEGGEVGAVAVVSSSVGARVLEASIARGEGTGELVFPETWIEPSALGSSCGLPPTPALYGHDLVEGGALSQERLDMLWATAGRTGLPLAMSATGQALRVVVLRYPRTLDEFDASTAEYLVVIEGAPTE